MNALALCMMWAGVGILVSVVSVPLILGWVPRNEMYGIRTPKTLASDRVWYPANRFGGAALALAGLFTVAGALVLLRFAPGMRLDTVAYIGLAICVIPLLVALVASFSRLAKL